MTEPNFADHSWRLRETDPSEPVYLLMHCVTEEMDEVYDFSAIFKARLDEVLRRRQAVPIVFSGTEGDVGEAPGLAEKYPGIIGFIKNEYDNEPVRPDNSTIIAALERDYPAPRYIIGGAEFVYECPLIAISPDEPFRGCASRLLDLANHGIDVSVDLSLCVAPSADLTDSYTKATSHTEFPVEYLKLIERRLAQLGIPTEPY